VAGIPRIGERAPAFEAETTQGPIRFPDDFQGRWLVFFSQAASFRPVCTTEFMTLAEMKGEFERLNCRLLGLSCDTVERQTAWLRAVESRTAWVDCKNVQLDFPVICDPDRHVARAYGILQPGNGTVRASFVIAPDSVIRASLYYPPSIGRNLLEIRRLLLALQLADRHQVATPANWQPGADVIRIPPPPGKIPGDWRENPFEDAQDFEWFGSSAQCPQ